MNQKQKKIYIEIKRVSGLGYSVVTEWSKCGQRWISPKIDVSAVGSKGVCEGLPHKVTEVFSQLRAGCKIPIGKTSCGFIPILVISLSVMKVSNCDLLNVSIGWLSRQALERHWHIFFPCFPRLCQHEQLSKRLWLFLPENWACRYLGFPLVIMRSGSKTERKKVTGLQSMGGEEIVLV